MTLMSLSASGVSFAVSGKSLSDHALSAVLNRDCAVWRPVKGEPVCREAESETQRLAILEPVIMAQRPQDVSREQRYEGETSDTHHATSRPGFSVGVTPPPQASAVSGSTAKLPFGVTAGPRQFWVVGSFSQRSNATRLANELSVDGSAVLTVRLAAGLRHRVIIGPQPQGNALLRDAIPTRGVEGAWPLTLCVPNKNGPEGGAPGAFVHLAGPTRAGEAPTMRGSLVVVLLYCEHLHAAVSCTTCLDGVRSNRVGFALALRLHSVFPHTAAEEVARY